MKLNQQPGESTTSVVVPLVIGLVLVAALVVAAFVIKFGGDEPYDASDFPEGASDFVDGCFAEDKTLDMVGGDPNTLACSDDQTTFFIGDVNVQCYTKGSDDWSTCPSSMMISSLDQALASCNKAIVAYVSNEARAYCLHQGENIDIMPGDNLECYSVVFEPELMECLPYLTEQLTLKNPSATA